MKTLMTMRSKMKTHCYPDVLVVLTALLVLAWPQSGWAQFTFITNADNTITITGYTGSGGNVVITNRINGYSVTAIRTNAFYDQYSVTGVTIPDSVTSIGDGAFGFCNSLTSVTLGNGVTNIGDDAFLYCSVLTSVTLPASVTTVGNFAFSGCYGLTNIDVDAANPSFTNADGVLFNKSLTTLVQYPGGLAGNYAIPDSVTSIGFGAFTSSSLTSVTIPDSVTNIGDFAFEDCGLTSVMIPNSVANIGDWAFAYCYGLQQAYFEGNAPSVNGGTGTADLTVFHHDPEHDLDAVFYVPGTTGWGAYFGGWPTAWWYLYLPQPRILGSDYGLGVGSQGFQFTIFWATNTAVVVEASTNLQTWTPVSTNTLVSGTNLFWDSDWMNYPQRFYRVGVEQ